MKPTVVLRPWRERPSIPFSSIGKRDMETNCIFMNDLRQRIINQPVINSDAFTAYPEAIER